MEAKVKRVRVLGVPVDCVNWTSATSVAEALLSSATKVGQAVIAVNPEKVIAARNVPALLMQLERADLLLPDGIGVVIAARFSGGGDIERVPGSEFMPALCAIARNKGLSVYLYGGTESVNARAAARLCSEFPGLVVAGRSNGYVSPESMDSLVETINMSGASILFVALGSPRQELWISRYGSHLKVKICQGVGGTFDVIAGDVKRAPALFRRFHLEWLFRLLTNPARARRQASLPKFVWLVAKDRLFKKPLTKAH